MAITGKRSIIPTNRLIKLSQQNAVYEVSCGVPQCPCAHPENGCKRGFFSLFIQAVYGIDFANRIQKPYHINFGNCEYSYADFESRGDANFWNYYFKQPIEVGSGENCLIINDFIEIYPLKIWSRSFLRRMSNKVVKHLEFKNELLTLIDGIKYQFMNQNILGVHIRGTDHREEVKPVKTDDYLREIDRRINKVDKLFLATDEVRIVDLFFETYGNMLIVNDVSRSENGLALHTRPAIENGYKLGLDAMADCYSLSLCKEAILTHSNLSYSALLFNPELKYKLMERLQPKIKRLKTLLLYNLDKWNIRKW